MFDKLIDLFVQFIELFRFFVVIDYYERGVVLRWGKYSRVLEPGLHWLWPLAENVLTDNIKVRTTHMSDQILTTVDGQSVVVAGIIKWSIADIRKALLEVDRLDDAYRDIVVATIADNIEKQTWEAIRSPDFSDELTKLARKAGWRYGVEVERLSLGNKAITVSLTLNKST